MVAPRSSFLAAIVAILALIAAEVDADKAPRSARRARRLAKSAKGTKAPKQGKSEGGMPPPLNHVRMRRLTYSGEQNRSLALQHMTDRFKEEGSVRSFVDSLGYEVDLKSGTGEKENVLSKEDCDGLMSLVDHGSYSNIDVPNVRTISKYIDESDLVSVIGKDKFNSLLDLHKEVVGADIPLESIMVRHMHGSANSDAFLEYHADQNTNEYNTHSTIAVALNDNSSIKEGGELYYLREDGPVLAPRSQGKAFVHSYNVLHGVTPHVGDRAILVLHFDHELKLEDVGGRKLTEETKEAFGTCNLVI